MRQIFKSLSLNYFIAFGLLCTVISCKNTNEKAATPENKIEIHTAILTDKLDDVKTYIQQGGDLNVKDPFGGSSPLISAAVFGKTEAAKLLLDAGADINFQNNDGSTALHTAAFFCRTDIVKLLLEKNADKTIKNSYEATPYDNVSAPFAQMKDAYDMMGQALGPMGLKMDYAFIEATRPEIAKMLQD
ncbi:MAG TPA: ankyrin repeat domain-containing protein [Saprospiraceae bacterium]|nr:ankyrin repeat domain-containing protein [Saprospiraceae bacterium]HPN71329.1 ankyrin repeat domain-containing protein [Saprospiraceae bacterium]